MLLDKILAQVAQLTDGVVVGSSSRVASLGGGFALARLPRALNQRFRRSMRTSGQLNDTIKDDWFS